MAVFIIVGAIFLMLFILIPLLERSKLRMSEEQTAKVSHWVLPLVLILAVAQLLMFYFG